jgi:hypothetical protein
MVAASIRETPFFHSQFGFSPPFPFRDKKLGKGSKTMHPLQTIHSEEKINSFEEKTKFHFLAGFPCGFAI